MSGLSMFLKHNRKEPEIEKYAASKNYTDETGAPVLWEIRALKGAEDEAIRAAFTRKVPVGGRRNSYMTEFDANGYAAKLAAAATVFPNLDDAALQDSYHVMGAEALLKEMLTAGEYQRYLRKVQEVNGFAAVTEEMVEEAKN